MGVLQAYWRATHPEISVSTVPRPMGASPQASPSGDQGRPTLPGASLYFVALDRTIPVECPTPD
jgi:hypothetical protein